VLLNCLNDDRELIKDILGEYLETAPSRLAEIRQAIGSGASSTVKELAHAFKGASGTIGAMAIQATTLRMEEAGKLEDLEAAAVCMERLQADFEALVARLGQIELAGSE
jgi:HPt (histidine-containing phosphotransfer) domain-containing protein